MAIGWEINARFFSQSCSIIGTNPIISRSFSLGSCISRKFYPWIFRRPPSAFSIFAHLPLELSPTFPYSLQSEDYDEEYTSFPLAVTLQQRLYFQVSVDTPDTRVGIAADFCYATPINSLSKKRKYDIILDGLVPTALPWDILNICYLPAGRSV